DQLDADLKAEHDGLINRAKRLEELEGISNELGGPAGERSRVPVGNDALPKVKEDESGMRGFRNQREFLESVMATYQTGRMDDRLKPLQVRNAAGSDEQSTQSDPYGGFLVPEAMLPGYLRTEP